MFDFDGAKLLIIGIVMLIAIPPRDLPGVMRQIGKAMAQLRRMAAEFQSQFHEAMREAELHDLKKDVETMTKVDLDGLDPFDAMRGEFAATKSEIEAGLNTPASPAIETSAGDPRAPLDEAAAPAALAPPEHAEAAPATQADARAPAGTHP